MTLGSRYKSRHAARVQRQGAEVLHRDRMVRVEPQHALERGLRALGLARGEQSADREQRLADAEARAAALEQELAALRARLGEGS